MGSIRKRNDSGRIFIDFRYKGIRCREQTSLNDTTANRRKAQKLLDHIEFEISNGTFEHSRFLSGGKNTAKVDVLNAVPQTVNSVAVNYDQPIGVNAANMNAPLFRDFAETWFAEKEVEWRKSHRIGTRADLDRLLVPHFGDKVVNQITKSDVLAFRAGLAKVAARGKTTALSVRRINKILGPLRQILCEAADRFYFRTPFYNLKQLRVRKTDVKPFTLDEVKLILDAVRKDFRNYYLVRFFTGMRTGEVDGLKWKYIDYDRRLILVRETVVEGEVDYTKNDVSQRDIQLSQVVFDALKEQERSTRHRSEFIFCNKSGKPLNHKNVTNRVWYPLLHSLGLEKRRPYHCRHTAATLWLASGEAPEWIARQMGHSTTEMLFRVYSRFVPNLTRQDGSAFDNLLIQTGIFRGGGSNPPRLTK